MNAATKAIGEVLVAVLRPRDARVAALEKRVKELEARPVAKDAGVWRDGVAYSAGDICSHGGSAWICRGSHFSTGTEPDHAHFRLLVKRGKDR